MKQESTPRARDPPIGRSLAAELDRSIDRRRAYMGTSRPRTQDFFPPAPALSLSLVRLHVFAYMKDEANCMIPVHTPVDRFLTHAPLFLLRRRVRSPGMHRRRQVRRKKVTWAAEGSEADCDWAMPRRSAARTRDREAATPAVVPGRTVTGVITRGGRATTGTPRSRFGSWKREFFLF